MDCLICKAPCRVRPTHRPNLRLSNPERTGGAPFWPSLLMLMTVATAAILSIWSRTCGMGVAC